MAVRSELLLGRLTRVVRSVWFAPALLMLVLGLYRIEAPEVWRDELATWSAATRSLPDLWRLLGNVDGVSGPYYLGMHLWTAVVGASPFALRLPSVLAMSAAAACVALAGRRLFDARAGLLAGLVFALIPNVSRFAQEARAYAFVVLGVAAATCLLLRACEKPAPGRWTAYGACVAFVGLVHVVGLAFLVGHAAGVVLDRVRHPRRGLLGFPLAVVLAVTAVAPLILVGRAQAPRQIFWPKPTLRDLPEILPQLFASASVAGAVVALAALAWAGSRAAAAFATAMALLPVVLVWLLSQPGQSSYWIARYLLFTLVAWALLAGAALAAVPARAAFTAFVALLVIAAPAQRVVRSEGGHDWWNYPERLDYVPLSYSGAAARIAAEAQLGDGIVFADRADRWMIDLGVYYHLPEAMRPRDVFLRLTPAQHGDLVAAECEVPAACLRGEERIWVVSRGELGDPYETMEEGKAAALRSSYRVTWVLHPRGMTVALLEKR